MIDQEMVIAHATAFQGNYVQMRDWSAPVKHEPRLEFKLLGWGRSVIDFTCIIIHK